MGTPITNKRRHKVKPELMSERPNLNNSRDWLSSVRIKKPNCSVRYPSDECGLIVLQYLRHCSITTLASFRL